MSDVLSYYVCECCGLQQANSTEYCSSCGVMDPFEEVKGEQDEQDAEDERIDRLIDERKLGDW